MTTTKNVRLRIWTTGAYTATQLETGTNNYNILEHDGRGRYHLVSMHGSKWREAELRIGGLKNGPKVAFKVSTLESQARIVTHWMNFARSGLVANGNVIIHADNSVTWSQVTRQKNGLMVKAKGDSFSKESVGYDVNGNVTSQSTQSEMVPSDLGQVRNVQTNADGSSTQSTAQTKRVADGTVTKTVTTQHDQGGNQTSQSTTVTKKSDDGSVTTQTITIDNGAGTKTETSSQRDAGSSITQTTTTDNTTGESVSTSNETITTTDTQGNVVTNTTNSVTSSDGFSVTQVTAQSSDGTTGYQQLTTDGQGNQTFTVSSTDNQGTTGTQSVSTDSSGVTIVTTTTDSSGSGTETTETYDANGNQTSSSTNSVGSGAASSSGSGSGDTSGSGSGDTSGSGSESMPSDDGTDEGPRSPTSHVSIGMASLDFDTIDGNGDQGTGSEGDFGNEGNPRIVHLGQVLGNYATSVYQNGWGDASSENAPSVPQVDVIIHVPTATDDWGDLNNPRAFTAFSMSMMIVAAGSNVASAPSGILRCLQTNANLNVQLAQMAI